MSRKAKTYTKSDYPELRSHFLNVFMKGTYKKKSYYEEKWGRILGNEVPQPRIRKRYLAESRYNGKYKPGSVHKPNPKYEPYEFPFLVIGRYYTLNRGYENYRIRVLNLKTGRIAFISVG